MAARVLNPTGMKLLLIIQGNRGVIRWSLKKATLLTLKIRFNRFYRCEMNGTR